MKLTSTNRSCGLTIKFALLEIRRTVVDLIVTSIKISGDFSGGVTPVPIPNTVVKPSSADGTALATMWESRSSPD